MTDYASLKVEELKKLLSDRGLPLSGKKADLVARLQENDAAAKPEAKGELQRTACDAAFIFSSR